MRLERQFSIFMVNKPGMLAKVLNEFSKAKVNIVALTVTDSVEHGVLRLVNGNSEKVRKILDRLNMPYNETEVLCVNLNNKAGALALITQKLAEARINLSYAYCTAGARGGRTTGVLKVADVKKAMKILRGHVDKKGKSKPALRRSPASRR